ncbi:hypothetical protein GUITHDRAFT_136641 [Guillardia theta CCMP2712]|uniref:Uncharacterized protein n=1 Tax=Guillardia theta (strain CCMP2712) TaxID=905079 RepID=L1JJ19_GUITC|nr:hypothetical protein GUITHDRAFT_136641 [Guillardia theta CCMP2712]EKX48523.1 hypothetical protein GUITHDRAFT_136641 [Guillardia theta CCMP2712]|eukprot:XP_005835503.1 hypothetical protein GUITHDRAFT_136641 [Guillardia theta CCMP2712]
MEIDFHYEDISSPDSKADTRPGTSTGKILKASEHEAYWTEDAKVNHRPQVLQCSDEEEQLEVQELETDMPSSSGWKVVEYTDKSEKARDRREDQGQPVSDGDLALLSDLRSLIDEAVLLVEHAADGVYEDLVMTLEQSSSPIGRAIRNELSKRTGSADVKSLAVTSSQENGVDAALERLVKEGSELLEKMPEELVETLGEALRSSSPVAQMLRDQLEGGREEREEEEEGGRGLEREPGDREGGGGVGEGRADEKAEEALKETGAAGSSGQEQHGTSTESTEETKEDSGEIDAEVETEGRTHTEVNGEEGGSGSGEESLVGRLVKEGSELLEKMPEELVETLGEALRSSSPVAQMLRDQLEGGREEREEEEEEEEEGGGGLEGEPGDREGVGGVGEGRGGTEGREGDLGAEEDRKASEKAEEAERETGAAGSSGQEQHGASADMEEVGSLGVEGGDHVEETIMSGEEEAGGSAGLPHSAQEELVGAEVATDMEEGVHGGKEEDCRARGSLQQVERDREEKDNVGKILGEEQEVKLEVKQVEGKKVEEENLRAEVGQYDVGSDGGDGKQAASKEEGQEDGKGLLKIRIPSLPETKTRRKGKTADLEFEGGWLCSWGASEV